MASDVIKWVLLAGGAYLVYTEFFATPAAAAAAPAAGSSGSTPPPAPPSYTYTPPSTVQQLQNAAGSGVTVLDADEWAYYWQQIGKAAIDPTVFGAIFFPQGRPANPAQNPTMNASQFLAAIATKGLSGRGAGLGAAVPVWLPVVVTPGGAQRRQRSNYRRRAA